ACATAAAARPKLHLDAGKAEPAMRLSMVERRLPLAGDPYGCREDLRDALDDTDLEAVGSDGKAPPEAASAAYEVAIALGRCRLFGVEPGEGLLATLPPHLALAAAAELTRLLGGWADLADGLGEAWLAAVDP